MSSRSRFNAFTLIEMLIVVSLMGILAATLIPSINPTIYEELHTAADAVAADLNWARTLAVTNNSTYRVTFDTTAETMKIKHSGTRSALNTLPKTPFTPDGSTDTEFIVSLKSMTQVRMEIEIVAVQSLGSTVQNVTTIDFNSLGATNRSEDTKIWLAAGTGIEKRYLGVRVNHVTGLTFIEDYLATSPLSSGSL